MRINKLLAQATGLSRRAADTAIQAGRVSLNGRPAKVGDDATDSDEVRLDGQIITAAPHLTIMLNKPAGYICSRDGQGGTTIYDLLPSEYHGLKPVGRLDKDSSGLLLLTNDGELANQLTHPRYAKSKVYEVALDSALTPAHQAAIERGVTLDDGLSALKLHPISDDKHWRVTMAEGRNRQIRRTFAALGYRVMRLNRASFGDYQLDDLAPGKYKII
ncbi:MAG TPA: pseudouridine synthase [Candidatus Saccharimonadales bacterium]